MSNNNTNKEQNTKEIKTLTYTIAANANPIEKVEIDATVIRVETATNVAIRTKKQLAIDLANYQKTLEQANENVKAAIKSLKDNRKAALAAEDFDTIEEVVDKTGKKLTDEEKKQYEELVELKDKVVNSVLYAKKKFFNKALVEFTSSKQTYRVWLEDDTNKITKGSKVRLCCIIKDDKLTGLSLSSK